MNYEVYPNTNFLYEFDVTTYTLSSATNYYSYMTMLHPVPCVEAIFSMTWAWLQSLPAVDASSMPDTIWLPWEDFQQCSDTWVATMEAYGMTYLASNLFEVSPIYDGDFTFMDAFFIFMFYASFGLMWIHGSYPNYVMADYTDLTVEIDGQ